MTNRNAPSKHSFAELLFDGNRGVYIPQAFAQDCAHWQGLDDKNMDTLKAGPDEEWYWEAWDATVDNAFYVDANGRRWTLHQSGDLWAVADDMPEEQREEFFGL